MMAECIVTNTEVNQRYIEDKEKVSKGDAEMQKAADHLADLF